MTDKSKEVKRAKSETQQQFERRVQREMLAIGKATERKAKKKYAGGVPDEPTDASAKNPVKGGKATKSEQEGRKK